MIKFNKYRSLTLAGLMLSACGGDESSVVDQIPVDYSGNWIGACMQADTSFAVDLGEVYYNDLINITDTRISTSTAAYSDSDCVTALSAPFFRDSQFEDAQYELIERFTTESGLIAHSIEIRVDEPVLLISNTMGISNDKIYFAFSPFDGPDEGQPVNLRDLDLENGYSRQ